MKPPLLATNGEKRTAIPQSTPRQRTTVAARTHSVQPEGNSQKSGRAASPSLQTVLSPTSGMFLSRSQDCLDGGSRGLGLRRKASTPTSSLLAGRPQSSLGIPKLSMRSAKPLASPVKDSSINVRLPDRAAVVNSAGRRMTPHQADARINKTKMTVTELQKAKQDLEAQLSELTKKADNKQAEMATMRIELRRLKETHHDEVGRLKAELEAMRKCAPNSAGDNCTSSGVTESTSSVQVDAATDPVKELDTDESDAAAIDWDRQSCSSEISFACLQDRIVQMEETHYCTTEELQATLQELTDLQDIVNDLTTENSQLGDDKHTLAETIFTQSQKLDRNRLQIANLKHLLLSGPEFRRSPPEADESDGREQRLVELLRATHDELEDLKCRYVDVRAALNSAQDENKERTDMVQVLRDHARLLESQNEGLSTEVRAFENRLLQVQSERDKDRRELMRMSGLYEKERCRSEELQMQSTAASKSELERMLDAARRDKDATEQRSQLLEESVAALKREIERLSSHRSTLGHELGSATEIAESLKTRLAEAELERDEAKRQAAEVHISLMESNDRCKRLMEDKQEYMANIVTLQQHADSLAGQRSALEKELTDFKANRQQQEEEWSQFETDLLVAVRVANDFKMEAQGDIDRLTEETTNLRNRLTRLHAELDRAKRELTLRTPLPMRTAAAAVGCHSAEPAGGGEIKSRIDSYLKGVAASSSSASATSRRESRSGSTVRSLIESMEPNEEGNAYRPARRRQDSTTTPAAFRQQSQSARSPSTDSPKSFRPTSVDSVDRLSQRIKQANSESEVAITSCRLPTTCSAQERLGDMGGEEAKPKGILVNKGSPVGVTAQKKAAYLDPEARESLGKLMKDAPRGSRRNALLKWCQNRLVNYKGVDITNFSSSWNDGLAFCALMHSYLPDKIPFDTLDNKDKRRNFSLAFEAAAEAGVPESLSVDEMVALERPDWQAVMGYVTSVYKQLDAD
uniref:Calponin-homology (CH) domain-containing protein n=1 Tax=Plectus sambesii TaxID=2011161 RepID=A0A914W4A3_9BILA